MTRTITEISKELEKLVNDGADNIMIRIDKVSDGIRGEVESLLEELGIEYPEDKSEAYDQLTYDIANYTIKTLNNRQIARIIKAYKKNTKT